MNQADIPIIDISALTRPDTTENELATVAALLNAACRHTGFFYVKGHGIPLGQLELLKAQAKLFFALPTDEKMQISMVKGGRAWRGYFPLGDELTSGRPDQKEGLYLGEELGSTDPRVIKGVPLHGPNLWPSSVPGLKASVLSHMAALNVLSCQLMEGLAIGLGLERGYFKQRFGVSPTQLFRIFNYPPHAVAPKRDDWGVRQHTDMGFLTILLQDGSGGLEVCMPDGRWVEASPVDGTFIVNLGDMLQKWTGGLYRATLHRVRNPSSHDRLSLPYFYDPGWEESVEPLPPGMILPPPPRHPTHTAGATGPQDSQRWDGLKLEDVVVRTYGEYVLAKIKGVFPQFAEALDP